MPCSNARARILLSKGRATVYQLFPFTIQLQDRESGELQPLAIKFDPGAEITGVAIVRKDGDDSAKQTVIHLSEITHRGQAVRKHMIQRAMFRRRRRAANLKYRSPRFDNRTKPQGWISPSLQSRVDNVSSWLNKYRRITPITAIYVEAVRFDTQALENVDIEGVEYQRGTLFGAELWEYLLEKWGRKCAYCDAEGVSLEAEHIFPRALGGSNRVSNLTLACHGCNQRKYATGLDVGCFSGGRTKFNRGQLGIPKAHSLDAACVGDVSQLKGWNVPLLSIKATGRGSYQRTRLDGFGFPRGYLTRQKTVKGFQTGDLVKATILRGKFKGTHQGRVAVRARGSFVIQTSYGKVETNWTNCKLIMHNDGYTYEIRPTAIPPSAKADGPLA
jgi:5-methylcytosine-specific restriction endonuclease McrA